MIDVLAVRRRVLAAAVAAVVVACGGDARPPPGEPEADGTPAQPRLPTGELVVRTEQGPVSIRVEIANTPESRARGLMGRRSLPEDAGMVFLSPQPTTGAFWMKDTLIPLSVAFWGENGRIRRILDMEPCRTEDCPLYDPKTTWVGAVEVNQGFFRERGIEVGDRVQLLGSAVTPGGGA